MLIISVTFNAVHWYMYYRMSEDLRWRRYKVLGTNPDTLRLYRRFELFAAMRKLDVQFSVIILVRPYENAFVCFCVILSRAPSLQLKPLPSPLVRQLHLLRLGYTPVFMGPHHAHVIFTYRVVLSLLFLDLRAALLSLARV